VTTIYLIDNWQKHGITSVEADDGELAVGVISVPGVFGRLTLSRWFLTPDEARDAIIDEIDTARKSVQQRLDALDAQRSQYMVTSLDVRATAVVIQAREVAAWTAKPEPVVVVETSEESVVSLERK
jgi:hypothetical protein